MYDSCYILNAYSIPGTFPILKVSYLMIKPFYRWRFKGQGGIYCFREHLLLHINSMCCSTKLPPRYLKNTISRLEHKEVLKLTLLDWLTLSCYLSQEPKEMDNHQWLWWCKGDSQLNLNIPHPPALGTSAPFPIMKVFLNLASTCLWGCCLATLLKVKQSISEGRQRVISVKKVKRSREFTGFPRPLPEFTWAVSDI